eukprot:COSAG05_NODE_19695_length_289_cov_0.673684_1_plen_80_part_01
MPIIAAVSEDPSTRQFFANAFRWHYVLTVALFNIVAVRAVVQEERGELPDVQLASEGDEAGAAMMGAHGQHETKLSDRER